MGNAYLIKAEAKLSFNSPELIRVSVFEEHKALALLICDIGQERWTEGGWHEVGLKSTAIRVAFRIALNKTRSLCPNSPLHILRSSILTSLDETSSTTILKNDARPTIATTQNERRSRGPETTAKMSSMYLP